MVVGVGGGGCWIGLGWGGMGERTYVEKLRASYMYFIVDKRMFVVVTMEIQ